MPKPQKCAYGTFIFKDGGYLPGLLLIAHKLRELDPQGVSLICGYTPDVEPHVVEILSTLYDEVYPIDYLKFGRDRKGRQAPLPYMFTRFRSLQLSEFRFDIAKILVLDADMLPLSSFVDLFELDTPAGVINEKKAHMKGSVRTDERLERWEWHQRYERLFKHGDRIPKEITDRPLHNPETNMGINGGLMLLAPSSADFEAFTKWCQQPKHAAIIDQMQWPDMQAITAFYSGRWTSIDASYLGLYGYPNVKSLKGIHFIGPKPWQWRTKGFTYRLNKYPDYRLWADEFIKMCTAQPELLRYKPLLALKKAIEAAAEEL